MLPTVQVSVHLAERFQRRRLKCEKLTDDIIFLEMNQSETRIAWAAMFVNGSG